MKLLDTLVAEMKSDVEIKDRRYNFKTYKKCFLGNEAVDWLLQNTAANTRVEALFVGQLMVSRCVRWAARCWWRLLAVHRGALRSAALSQSNDICLHRGFIAHVVNQHTLKDKRLFYRFVEAAREKRSLGSDYSGSSHTGSASSTDSTDSSSTTRSSNASTCSYKASTLGAGGTIVCAHKVLVDLERKEGAFGDGGCVD